VLARGTRDSVGLDAGQRAANLAGRVRFTPRGSPPPGAAVVLLDDVLATGATVTASMAALHRHRLTVAGVLVLAAVPALRPAVLPRPARHGARHAET
jgi:predicted amidophosphoribosyltransferase